MGRNDLIGTFHTHRSSPFHLFLHLLPLLPLLLLLLLLLNPWLPFTDDRINNKTKLTTTSSLVHPLWLHLPINAVNIIDIITRIIMIATKKKSSPTFINFDIIILFFGLDYFIFLIIFAVGGGGFKSESFRIGNLSRPVNKFIPFGIISSQDSSLAAASLLIRTAPEMKCL